MARPPKTFYTLSNKEKEIWLDQHVPHRICAALTWLTMPGIWAMPQEPALQKGAFHVWCIGRSVDEGRKAAMRWLIEFIGVTADDNGNPVGTEPHRNNKSVTIAKVGGRVFDTKSKNARTLSTIWKACSQASMHPTMGTTHDPDGPAELAAALQIVIAHLDDALYKPNHRNLWQIVHEQEKLAIARAATANAT